MHPAPVETTVQSGDRIDEAMQCQHRLGVSDEMHVEYDAYPSKHRMHFFTGMAISNDEEQVPPQHRYGSHQGARSDKMPAVIEYAEDEVRIK